MGLKAQVFTFQCFQTVTDLSWFFKAKSSGHTSDLKCLNVFGTHGIEKTLKICDTACVENAQPYFAWLRLILK